MIRPHFARGFRRAVPTTRRRSGCRRGCCRRCRRRRFHAPAYVPGSPTCVESQGPVGLAGRASPIAPHPRSQHQIWLAVGVDILHRRHFRTLGAGGTTAAMRIPSPRFAFRIHIQPAVPEVDANSTSGQPSPVKSPANSSQFDENLVDGLVAERHVELAHLREIRSRKMKGPETMSMLPSRSNRRRPRRTNSRRASAAAY